MGRVTDKELKNYYSQIGRLILCGRKQKKDFLCQLKENVEEFVSDTPEATMEDIEKAFGTPESIGGSFIENTDSIKIKKQIRLKKFLVIAVVIALIIYALFVVLSLIDVHTEAYGYFEEGFLTVGNMLKGGGVL
ncbi:MAG: hypothetical protein IJB74_09505 [Clostridia bacterium]|nr:hypothetical protein [Clostridia bacterium]